MTRALFCLLLFLSRFAHAGPTRGELQLVTCPRASGEFLATLAHRVVLHRAFVESGPGEDDEIRQGIKLQLKNLWGYFRNSEDPALRLVLSAAEPQIAIKKKTAVRYGRDLVIDWRETDPQLALTSPYLLRAVARGHTGKDDAAIQVEYEARFLLAACGQTADPGAALVAALPADPWLLYWHVAKAQRRLMRYLAYEATTTPCSAPDFAELPNPEYYWYDWQPSRRGKDGRGRPYDCRALLRPGVDYHPVRVPLKSIARPTTNFAALRALPGPLLSTVLIGVVDHQRTALSPKGLVAALGKGRGELPARAAAALVAYKERGTMELLSLLKDLPQVATIDSFQATAEEDFLRVEVAARLLRSARPLRLRAYLGLTDVLGPAPPRHWPILYRALGEDNFIIYAGHSGLGENFRLARIEAGAARTHKDFLAAYRRAPFQLVAFLSCYSYMYFGEDLLAASAERAAAGTEFVYTGAEATRGDRGTLALLDLADQAIAPGAPGPIGALRFLDPEEILLIKHLPLRTP